MMTTLVLNRELAHQPPAPVRAPGGGEDRCWDPAQAPSVEPAASRHRRTQSLLAAGPGVTGTDIVGTGGSTFRLADGELAQFVGDGEVSFTADDLVVRVSGGKVLLDHVTFPIPDKCLLAVIGPSGAGKSTLLGALTGMRPADSGTVLYDNRDLYRNYGELRHRIGLVPQQSVLHTQLTARRALQYTAELRFPADTRAAERDGRVEEVIRELDLTRHAQTRAERLSGGQLKRVNVAQELLTKPSLLFLDEPTSGLDPNLDKQVMEQMRDLAHDGRTVVVVTHSVAHLDMCDRLLVLFPGGKVAFYGPPAEGLSYFGLPGWAEVFEAFERYPDRDWAGEFKASPAYARYVAVQLKKAEARTGDMQLPEARPRRGALRQMSTLTRRYVRVIAADRGYLLFMALLPVILGALIHLAGASQGLAGPPYTNQNAQETLLLLVICACLSGAASSVRELVKERDIYVRERAAGLCCGAYLCSKLLVLGVITVVQSLVLVLLGAGRPAAATHRLAPDPPAAGRVAARCRRAGRSLDVPGPAGVLPGQHVGEGDAVPGAAHHGPGHLVRRRAVAEREGRAEAAGLAGPGPLGVRRGGVDLRPQRHQPVRGELHPPAVEPHGEHLAARHRPHRRAGGHLRAAHLGAAAPYRPAHPQGLSEG